MTDRMPALYIGHGAPPLLDDPLWSSQLSGLAGDLPRPTAILIVSAHWESAPVMLSADGAPLVYDFGGFPEKYYRMTYATPPATALAQRIAAMMPADEPVHQHTSRGLDHGAWVPLKIMYPDGDIPVLQMSLPTQDPTRLLELGERLRPLRDEGVLIIGSGFLTHGLPFLTEFRIDADAPGWSQDFDSWAAEALAPRRRRRARVVPVAGARACPTPTRPWSTTRRSSSPSAPRATPSSRASSSSRASGWACRSARSRSPERRTPHPRAWPGRRRVCHHQPVTESPTTDAAERFRQTLEEMADLVGDRGHHDNPRRWNRLVDAVAGRPTPAGRDRRGASDHRRPHGRPEAGGPPVVRPPRRCSGTPTAARPVLTEIRDSPMTYDLHSITAKHTLLDFDAGSLDDDDRLPGT